MNRERVARLLRELADEVDGGRQEVEGPPAVSELDIARARRHLRELGFEAAEDDEA